jgi:Ca2+-binding EF-hand superfamily protein
MLDDSEEFKENEKWKDILGNIDSNNDGSITFDEFCAAFDDFITQLHKD